MVDSAARIGGDTVVLGGNAVYEADESISGSAYVLGGHLSHVTRSSGEGEQRHRGVTWASCCSFGGVGGRLLLLLLLSGRMFGAAGSTACS